jgi:hypothetical protein
MAADFGPSVEMSGCESKYGGYIRLMDEKCEVVHAHQMDADKVIEQFHQRGYVLVARTPPTIIAQAGFERFEFLPKELAGDIVEPEAVTEPSAATKVKKRILGFLSRSPAVD